MKLKLILATVIFAPTIVMAQVTDKPVIAPPEVLKESVITRPGEGGSGVYKPVEQANAIKPKGIKPPVAITDVTTKGGSGIVRNNGWIADSAK
jgi:hypothetical protein